jgi:hypothetical protein
MRLRLRRAIFIGTVTALFIWSCGGSDEEKLKLAKLSEGCSLNSDCNDPLVCTFERCHQACEADRDCPLPQRCVRGTDGRVCQLPDDTDCARDSECEGDQVCGIDGECRDQCGANSDCGDDQICANSGECASEDPDRDTVDDDGNIVPDGNGGEGGMGSGGTSTGGRGGTGTGGTGEGGEGGMNDGGMSSGGTDTGGMGGTAGSGMGGTGGMGCPTGYGDCDDDPEDCETPLSLITSCGSCTTACDASHGDVRCDAMTLECVVGPMGCTTGWDDCDDDAATGCEAQLAVDPENCGMCARSCGGGTCAASQCGPALVMDPPGNESSNNVQGFLVGNRVISSSNYSGWALRSVTLPLDSTVSEGTVIHSWTTGTGISMDSVVFDNTYVYFAQTANPASMLRKALDGTGSTSEVFSAPYYPRFAALSATAFYFFAAMSGGYGIYTVPKTGGTPAVITGLSGRSSSFYDLAISATHIYWVEYISPTYRVFGSPLAGGTPVELDSDVGNGGEVRIATDTTHAYWNTYFASGKIRRVAHGGSAANVTDVAVGLTSPRQGLAVDANYVYYWNSSSGHRVYRVTKDASDDPEELAVINSAPYFLNVFGVDSTHVYGVGNQGQIVRVTNSP